MLFSGFVAFSVGVNSIIRKARKREGSVKEICRGVVDDCWNGKYFVAGTHFNQFWSRDFGWCVKALVKEGYRDRVIRTLRNVLQIFEKEGKVKVLVAGRKGIDYPSFAVDSLPWIVRALRESGLREFRTFIEKEASRLAKLIDRETHLLRKGYFASIRDCAVRNSSTYDNTMLAMLSSDLDALGFKNPLSKFRIKDAMIKYLWTGTHFKNDLDDESVSADAVVFPFTTGVFKDKGMIKSSIEKAVKEGLSSPAPLKFSVRDIKKPIVGYSLLKNYQGTSVWTHTGPLFISLLRKVRPALASRHIRTYKKIIRRFGTYPEVLNSHLNLFRTPFYRSDEGMLWAVNFLRLI